MYLLGQYNSVIECLISGSLPQIKWGGGCLFIMNYLVLNIGKLRFKVNRILKAVVQICNLSIWEPKAGESGHDFQLHRGVEGQPELQKMLPQYPHPKPMGFQL